MRKSSLLVGFSLLVLFFSLTGCYKINHNYIMKGYWYVNAFEVNGGSTNLMEGVLPHYLEGNGQYYVYMLDNGLLRGEYYVADTLYYFRTGYWDMPHKDSVYFNVDVFIDGHFYIEQVNKKAFLLSSIDNNISFFNLGRVNTVMRISRGEYVDPADTK
jgi:hypothetical protein